MPERRKFTRFDVPLSLNMKLLGTGKDTHPIKGQTRNVSLDGLLIEAQVFLENDTLLVHKGEQPVKLDPFLVLNEKLVELDIKTPPLAHIIRATGRVMWYDLCARGSSYYFRAGIALEKLAVQDAERWTTFVTNISAAQD